MRVSFLVRFEPLHRRLRAAPRTVDAVRHAGPDALDRLEPMLMDVRDLPGLVEKSRGTFYRGSRAFLHFHEDPAGLFADVRLHDEFERWDVTTRAYQRRLVTAIRKVLRDR
jgi:hypothetical protein